jgi:dienelactone hydrolase
MINPRLFRPLVLACLFLFPLPARMLPLLMAQSVAYPPIDQVRQDFQALLKRPKVPFAASFQMTRTDSVLIEKGFIYSEAGEKIPILIYKPAAAVGSETGSFPVVICLHGTGGSKEDPYFKKMLYAYTKMGFIGVAIDARYHGERVSGGAHGSKEYVEAITRAWENKDKAHQAHPFYYDTVYDLWRLTDYLVTRPDVRADRIGMTGVSMGGIETWMAASADTRIKVAVVDIGAQSFNWSLENDRWQGRAHTIWGAHEQAAKDRGDTAVNQGNVKALWDKVVPGITGEFDCPSMLRLLAPRPLLILSNEKDLNCPLPGAKLAYASAASAYAADGAAAKLAMDVAPGVGHQTLPGHYKMTIDWFGKWL